MKRKILALILSMIMLIGLLPTMAWAADEPKTIEVDGSTMTLAAAVEGANSGDTITLLNDVIVSQIIEIPEGKAITINGGGHKVSFSTKCVFNNYGLKGKTSLTVNNIVFEGTNPTGSNIGYPVVTGRNFTGSVTLDSCTFKNIRKCAVYMDPNGTEEAALTIKNCTYDNTPIGYSIDMSRPATEKFNVAVTFTGNKGYTTEFEVFNNMVAVVQDSDGKFKGQYATLADAIVAAAQNGDTVKLLKDVENVGTVSLPAGVTLDGNGHKISGSSCVYLNSGCTVSGVFFRNIGNAGGKLSPVYDNAVANGQYAVTNCTFEGWNWDAIQFHPKAGSVYTITGNTFSALAGENVNRTVHIQSNTTNVDFTATVTGNKFLGCKNLKNTGIEVYYPVDATKLDCSGNYMDAPMGVCIGTGDSFNNAYAEAFPFKNAEFTQDVTIAITVFDPADNTYFYPTEADAIAAGVVAKIGDMGYKTLAKAVAAVPADNTETEIDMIADETIIGNAGVTIPANKNIILDLNGKTITNYLTESKKSQAIINIGTLTIKDTSNAKTGTMVNNYAETITGDWPTYNYQTNLITNQGTLKISGGNFNNTADSGICYCVDNVTNGTSCTPVLTIDGGNFTAAGNSAVRMFCNSTTNDNSVTINDGTLTAKYYGISVQNANDYNNKGKLTVNGGRFIATDTAYNLSIACWKDVSSQIQINITDGRFDDCIANNCSIAISGGLYAYKEYTDPDTSTTYNLADYVATGYACVALKETDPAYEDVYHYIVKPVDINIEPVVVDGDDIKIGGQVIDVTIQGDSNLQDVATAINDILDNTALADVESNIGEAIDEVKVVTDLKNQAPDNVKTLVTKSDNEYVEVELTAVDVVVSEDNKITSMTFDVQPMAMTTVTNTSGTSVTVTAPISNDAIDGLITFRLPVADGYNTASLSHKGSVDAEFTLLGTFPVQGENGNRYIEASASEFSLYKYELLDAGNAVARIGEETDAKYYASLANAIDAAQPEDNTITLLKDSESGEITVNKEVTFTLILNGKTLNATIVAGEGYTLSRSGNTYTVKKYVAPSYSGGGATTYAVTVESARNGSVSADKKSASANSTVTITVSPDKGFTLETLTVTDKNGKEVDIKNLGNNKFSFKMPASKVTVEATFMEDNTMLNFFVDVPATEYYYDAVLWAAENGITTGVDAVHFGPEAPVTRGQVVTFLWRAAGKPVVNYYMNMSDVKSGEYYSEAVRWALSEGITKGTTDTTFEPETVCTRGQIVTFLARFAGVKDAETESVFTDVPATEFFAAAVKWAKDNGVTSGITETTFEPYTNCNRAQVVTFLYRWMVK